MAEDALLRDRLPIVIPVFNGWRETRVCLEALRAGGTDDYIPVVVDHGSTDDTKTGLRESFPEAIHLLGDESLWWTGATNMGIRWALARGAHHVMLLNNDCYFEAGALATLTRHARAEPGSVVAPVQKDAASGAVLCTTAGTLYLLGFPTFRPRRTIPASCRSRPLCPTRMIIGGRGAIVPASVFERVGVLDEDRLPHYGSDNDFYMRCRAAGVPLRVATDSAVLVDSGRTTLASGLGTLDWRAFRRTLRDRRSHRNLSDQIALFRKHYPIPGLHGVGVALNLVRYATRWGFERLLRRARHAA